MSNHEERALDYLCGWMREPTPRLIDDLAEQFRQVENAAYERVESLLNAELKGFTIMVNQYARGKHDGLLKASAVVRALIIQEEE